jgi:hypothetical protein
MYASHSSILESPKKTQFGYSYMPSSSSHKPNSVELTYTPYPLRRSVDLEANNADILSNGNKHNVAIDNEMQVVQNKNSDEDSGSDQETNSVEADSPYDGGSSSSSTAIERGDLFVIGKRTKDLLVSEQPNSAYLTLLLSGTSVAFEPDTKKHAVNKAAYQYQIPIIEQMAISPYDSTPFDDIDSCLLSRLSVEYCMKTKYDVVQTSPTFSQLKYLGKDTKSIAKPWLEEITCETLSLAVDPLVQPGVPPDVLPRMLADILPVLQDSFSGTTVNGPQTVGNDIL